MDFRENKQIVGDFFKSLNEHKLVEAFGLLHEDMNWWILGNILVSGNYDKRKISLGLKMLHRNFNGFTFFPSIMTAEENRVSVIVESKGIRKSNERNYNNHYHFLITIEDGKIKDVKEYFDTVHAVWVEEPV